MVSVWPGQDPNFKFYGLVTQQMKFKGRKGEMINGYEVLWDDGERERWPYSYSLDALVPDEDPLILSDDDDDTDDDITETNSDSDESDRGIHYMWMCLTQ